MCGARYAAARARPGDCPLTGVQVAFLGCRGSTPVSGRRFARYGAATSCVAVSDGNATAPRLLLDAGTGLVNLAGLVGTEPFRGTVLLSHLHWDHTHGLPFARNLGLPNSRVDLLLPEQGDDPTVVMDRAFSPPHFPVTIGQLGDQWAVAGVEPGVHKIEGYRVLALEIPHKGGRTYGYRVEGGGAVLAYLPDHKPLEEGPGPDGLGEYHEAALRLADGADLLIHDAQHTAAELPAKAFLGHSAVEYAVGLGVAAGARQVALFHHDPGRSDREVDAIVAGLGHPPIRVFAAREGGRRTVRRGRRTG
jgi:phosphoribosyl 1,2-cyclic phosphodiesterase